MTPTRNSKLMATNDAHYNGGASCHGNTSPALAVMFCEAAPSPSLSACGHRRQPWQHSQYTGRVPECTTAHPRSTMHGRPTNENATQPPKWYRKHGITHVSATTETLRCDNGEEIRHFNGWRHWPSGQRKPNYSASPVYPGSSVVPQFRAGLIHWRTLPGVRNAINPTLIHTLMNIVEN